MHYEKKQFRYRISGAPLAYVAVSVPQEKASPEQVGAIEQKNRLVETAISLHIGPVNKPKKTFFDINVTTTWRRHGEMVRSRQHALPRENHDPGCLAHAAVAGGCDEWQGLELAKSDTRKLIDTTESSL